MINQDDGNQIHNSQSSTFNRYYCTLCYNVWDNDQHQPKMLQCRHCYCLKCLQKLFMNGQIVCPEDQQVQKLRSLQQLITNDALLNPGEVLITTRTSQYKLLESMNTIEKSYSNHKSFDDSKPQIRINSPPKSMSNDYSQAKEILQGHQQRLKNKFQEFELNSSLRLNEIIKYISLRKQQNASQIENQFNDLIQKVRNTESLILQELNVITIKLEDQVREMHTQIVKNQQKTYQQLQLKITQLMGKSNMDNELNSISEINQQIDHLVQLIDKEQDYQANQIIGNTLFINFDHTIYDFIPRFCRLGSQNNQLRSPSPIKKEQFSQSSISKKQTMKPQTSRNRYSRQPIQYSKNSHLHLDPSLERTYVRQLTFGKTVDDSMRSHDKKSQSSKKLHLSQVFPRIEKQLENGVPIVKLDMTNQGLMDKDIQEIVQLIKESNSKIEILKLTKNKITDIGFGYLLQCFNTKTQLHTINLTSNLCTDKSIQLIEKNKQSLIGKTIYLSNCKLNPNKLKYKQMELQDFGIYLYL